MAQLKYDQAMDFREVSNGKQIYGLILNFGVTQMLEPTSTVTIGMDGLKVQHAMQADGACVWIPWESVLAINLKDA